MIDVVINGNEKRTYKLLGDKENMIIRIRQGFISYRRIGKEKHRLFELTRIEVLPKYRRQGYGLKLFDMLLIILKRKRFRKLFTTTHASNKTAHKFYENMCMKMEAVLPNHYYDEEPELVYSLFNG